MHVARQSGEELILEHRPWLTGAVLIALAVGGPLALSATLRIDTLVPFFLAVFIFGFPALALFAVYVRRLLVVLDRRHDRLRLHERSLLRDRVCEVPLSRFAWAERETRFVHMPFLPRHGRFHRAVLVFADKGRLSRLPLTSVFLVGPSARKAVSALNRWTGRRAPRRPAGLSLPVDRT